MAKTNFIDGTIVEPEFLNAIFSHDHDGTDDDGHAPKISLLDHVAEISQGTFTFGFDIGFASTQNVRVDWKLESNAGTGKPDIATLTFQGLDAESNGTALGHTGAILTGDNAVIVPASDTIIPVCLMDHAQNSSGGIWIGSDGSIYFGLFQTISGDASAKSVFQGSGFTDHGNKGFSPFTVHYPIY